MMNDFDVIDDERKAEPLRHRVWTDVRTPAKTASWLGVFWLGIEVLENLLGFLFRLAVGGLVIWGVIHALRVEGIL